MFYNVEFFFEKPYRLFTTEEETIYTVSKEDFELYNSGRYIKGEDGTPIEILHPIRENPYKELKEEEKVENKFENIPEVSNEQIMSVLSELSETMAQIMGDKND